MALQPDNTWRWFFEQQQQRLLLDVGADMTFVSALGRRQLIAARLGGDLVEGTDFSIAHAADYQVYMESLQHQLGIGADMAAHISLNAVATRHFHRPLMPKSWFFLSPSATMSTAEITPGRVVCLQSPLQNRHYLVVESDHTASVLLLIERCHELSDTESIEQFTVLKVMNDRLKPMSVATPVASPKAVSAA